MESNIHTDCWANSRWFYPWNTTENPAAQSAAETVLDYVLEASGQLKKTSAPYRGISGAEASASSRKEAPKALEAEGVYWLPMGDRGECAVYVERLSSIDFSHRDWRIPSPARVNDYEKFRTHLFLLTWDLAISRFAGVNGSYTSIPEHLSPWLRVSLSNRHRKRVASFGLSVEVLRRVVNWLELLGLVFRVPGHSGEATRVKPTPTLWSMLDGVEPGMFNPPSADEIYAVSISLAGADNPFGPFDDDDVYPGIDAQQLRDNLRYINERLSPSHTCIGIDLSPSQWDAMIKQLAGKSKRSGIPNWRRFWLARPFKDKFQLCGRWYGGWWQNLPSQYRKHITINGAKTVEVDYSSLHPLMLYSTNYVESREFSELETRERFFIHENRGTPKLLTSDPYTIPGHEDDRDLFKFIFMAVLNAEPGKTKETFEANAVSTCKWDKDKREPRPEFAHLDHKEVKDLIRAFVDHHKPIAHHFFTGGDAANLLQRKDSDMAERVMLELWERDIPCLPVHDSFIVPEQHLDMLRGQMELAIKEQYPELGLSVPLLKATFSDGRTKRFYLRGPGSWE